MILDTAKINSFNQYIIIVLLISVHTKHVELAYQQKTFIALIMHNLTSIAQLISCRNALICMQVVLALCL